MIDAGPKVSSSRREKRQSAEDEHGGAIAVGESRETFEKDKERGREVSAGKEAVRQVHRRSRSRAHVEGRVLDNEAGEAHPSEGRPAEASGRVPEVSRSHKATSPAAKGQEQQELSSDQSLDQERTGEPPRDDSGALPAGGASGQGAAEPPHGESQGWAGMLGAESSQGLRAATAPPKEVVREGAGSAPAWLVGQETVGPELRWSLQTAGAAGVLGINAALRVRRHSAAANGPSSEEEVEEEELPGAESHGAAARATRESRDSLQARSPGHLSPSDSSARLPRGGNDTVRWQAVPRAAGRDRLASSGRLAPRAPGQHGSGQHEAARGRETAHEAAAVELSSAAGEYGAPVPASAEEPLERALSSPSSQRPGRDCAALLRSTGRSGSERDVLHEKRSPVRAIISSPGAGSGGGMWELGPEEDERATSPGAQAGSAGAPGARGARGAATQGPGSQGAGWNSGVDAPERGERGKGVQNGLQTSLSLHERSPADRRRGFSAPLKGRAFSAPLKGRAGREGRYGFGAPPVEPGAAGDAPGDGAKSLALGGPQPSAGIRVYSAKLSLAPPRGAAGVGGGAGGGGGGGRGTSPVSPFLWAGIYQDTGASPTNEPGAGAGSSEEPGASAGGGGLGEAGGGGMSRTERDIQRAYESFQRRQELKARLLDPQGGGRQAQPRARSVPRGGQHRPGADAAPGAGGAEGRAAQPRRSSASVTRPLEGARGGALSLRVEQIYGSARPQRAALGARGFSAGARASLDRAYAPQRAIVSAGRHSIAGAPAAAGGARPQPGAADTEAVLVTSPVGGRQRGAVGAAQGRASRRVVSAVPRTNVEIPWLEPWQHPRGGADAARPLQRTPVQDAHRARGEPPAPAAPPARGLVGARPGGGGGGGGGSAKILDAGRLRLGIKSAYARGPRQAAAGGAEAAATEKDGRAVFRGSRAERAWHASVEEAAAEVVADDTGGHPWSWIRDYPRPPSRQRHPTESLHLSEPLFGFRQDPRGAPGGDALSGPRGESSWASEVSGSDDGDGDGGGGRALAGARLLQGGPGGRTGGSGDPSRRPITQGGGAGAPLRNSEGAMAFRPGTSVEAASAASGAPEWVSAPAAPPGSAAGEGEGWGGARVGRAEGSCGSSADSPRESMSGSERSRSAESDALSLSLETSPSLKAPGSPAPGARADPLRAGPSESIGGAGGAAIESSRQLARPTSRKALHSDGALAATVQRDGPCSGGLPGDLSLTRISISGDSSGSSSASPPRAARGKSLRAPPEPSSAPPHQGKASPVRAPSPGSAPRRAQREAASAEEATGAGGLGLSGRIMYQPPGSGALGRAEGVPRPATRARSALLSGGGARGLGGALSGSGAWRAVKGGGAIFVLPPSGGQDAAGGADADAGEGAGGRRVIQSAGLMRRKVHARPATARGARVASPTMRAPGGLGQSSPPPRLLPAAGAPAAPPPRPARARASVRAEPAPRRPGLTRRPSCPQDSAKGPRPRRRRPRPVRPGRRGMRRRSRGRRRRRLPLRQARGWWTGGRWGWGRRRRRGTSTTA